MILTILPQIIKFMMLLANYTQEGNVDAGRILKAVLPFTFGLEAIGAVIYFTQFSGMELYDRIFCSLFQAVSSFCNVGFTLFPDSLVRFQLNPLMNITTCVLALAGGFGFLMPEVMPVHCLFASLPRSRRSESFSELLTVRF